MLRRLLCTAVALLFVTGGLLAAEVKGKVKSVDADKGTITVTVGEQDQTFTVAKDAKVSVGKVKDVKDIKDLKVGANVTLTTEKKDGKEVVTGIKGGGGAK
jgi:Cu/Ag efflux protein CusF